MDSVSVYETIKGLIDMTEKSIHEKHKECIDNNWMDEFVNYSNRVKSEAVETIKDLTKD